MADVRTVTAETTKNGRYERVMVGTSATLIRGENVDRINILLQNLSNTGSDNLYIGFDADVTTLNGILVQEKGTWDSWSWCGAVYGISDGDPIDVRYMEEQRD